MTETTESVMLETWSTPKCPFTIEYSRRLLDDIRLAVVDAFFSLPRGGAEIGGVLLGKFADGRVSILDYIPLECEHIFGPSFTLSPGDHKRLEEMVAGAAREANDLQPVGWYHSHTRSDIFLSDADLDIHNRYFPNPWQVALVLRPSTFQPVQAGFFFREADGSINHKGTYQEFALDPLPVGQVPRGMPTPAMQQTFRQPEPVGAVITVDAAPIMPPAQPDPPPAAAESVSVPASPPAPPPRPMSLPPELPPLPRLELVPNPADKPEPPAIDELRKTFVEHTPDDGAIVFSAEAEKYQSYTFVPWVPAPGGPARAPQPPHEPMERVEPVAQMIEPETTPVVVETERPIEPVAWFDPEPPPAPVAFFQAEPSTPELPTEPAKTLVEPEQQLVAETGVAHAETLLQPEPLIEPASAFETQDLAAPEPHPHEPSAEPVATEPPNFLQVEPPKPRRWLWAAGAAAVAVLLGAGGYQQRANWMGQVKAMLPQQAAAPAPPPVPLTLPLTASEEQGQLQIRWDGAARAVAGARDGILQITDDGTTTDLPLDAAHLRSGGFTYARFGEHVDARLTIQELDGTQVRTVTSFYGALPASAKSATADAGARKENSDLTKNNGALTKENGDLRQRVEELTKQAAELRQQRDDLTRDTAKLKGELAAQAVSEKQKTTLAQENVQLRQERDELNKETAKLKAEMAAQAASAKQKSGLAQENADLRKQRDDLANQTAKLKADLAASRAVQTKQSKEQPQPMPKDQLVQQRDDLLIQIAKLKGELAAQASGGKQGGSGESTEVSKQRYQLVNRVSQLESDLAVAQARAEKLERQVEDLRKNQLQRRLQNQSVDLPH